MAVIEKHGTVQRPIQVSGDGPLLRHAIGCRSREGTWVYERDAESGAWTVKDLVFPRCTCKLYRHRSQLFFMLGMGFVLAVYLVGRL